MDDLEYLADTETQKSLRDYPYESRTEREHLRLPPDIVRDMGLAGLENGYGSLQAFIEDMCISVTLRWREARDWNQAINGKEGTNGAATDNN